MDLASTTLQANTNDAMQLIFFHQPIVCLYAKEVSTPPFSSVNKYTLHCGWGLQECKAKVCEDGRLEGTFCVIISHVIQLWLLWPSGSFYIGL